MIFLQDFLLQPHAARALLVTGGVAPSADLARIIMQYIPQDAVFCADAGADACRDLGLLPRFIVGDMDSLSADSRAWALAQGIDLLKYPPEKDDTDTALALDLICDRLPQLEELVVLGALGGRMDHELANISLLAAYGRRGGPALIFVDDQNVMRYLGAGSAEIAPQAGYFGLVGLSDGGWQLSIENAKYDLPDSLIPFGLSRLVSNEFLNNKNVCIHVADGDGILILSHDKK